MPWPAAAAFPHAPPPQNWTKRHTLLLLPHWPQPRMSTSLPGRPGRVTVMCACSGVGGGPGRFKWRKRLQDERHCQTLQVDISSFAFSLPVGPVDAEAQLVHVAVLRRVVRVSEAPKCAGRRGRLRARLNVFARVLERAVWLLRTPRHSVWNANGKRPPPHASAPRASHTPAAASAA